LLLPFGALSIRPPLLDRLLPGIQNQSAARRR
jgi:hypothetical protein